MLKHQQNLGSATYGTADFPNSHLCTMKATTWPRKVEFSREHEMPRPTVHVHSKLKSMLKLLFKPVSGFSWVVCDCAKKTFSTKLEK